MPVSRSRSRRKLLHHKKAHVNARLRGAETVVNRTAEAYFDVLKDLNDHKAQIEHLARVLAYVIAANGGELIIPEDRLAQIPSGARLQRMYDAEAKLLRFVTVVDSPAGAIQVVKPKIELVTP